MNEEVLYKGLYKGVVKKLREPGFTFVINYTVEKEIFCILHNIIKLFLD